MFILVKFIFIYVYLKKKPTVFVIEQDTFSMMVFCQFFFITILIHLLFPVDFLMKSIRVVPKSNQNRG